MMRKTYTGCDCKLEDFRIFQADHQGRPHAVWSECTVCHTNYELDDVLYNKMENAKSKFLDDYTPKFIANHDCVTDDLDVWQNGYGPSKPYAAICRTCLHVYYFKEGTHAMIKKARAVYR